MENQDNNSSLFDITFDDNAKRSLKTMATWGSVAAIFGLTNTVLGIVTHFVGRDRPQTNQYEGFRDVQYESQQADSLVFLLIGLVISGFLFYFLNRFGKLTKTGIDGNNTSLITEGLGSLSTYFKILGVLIIIFLLFALIALVFIASYSPGY